MLPDSPSLRSETLLTSFTTAWICAIAFARALLPAENFSRIPFAHDTIHALRVPNSHTTHLSHRGLYAWLSEDAPRHARALPVRVTLLVRQRAGGDADVIEAYEMSCCKARRNAWTCHSIQNKTHCILRSLRLFCITLPALPPDALVDIHVSAPCHAALRTAIVGEDGVALNRMEIGELHAGCNNIRCAVFVRDPV